MSVSGPEKEECTVELGVLREAHREQSWPQSIKIQ